MTPCAARPIALRRPDLTNWTEAPVAALDATDPLLQEAILFRPAVIYNPTTRKYVLWVNRIPKGYSVWDGIPGL